jgi:DNA adenine methylase
MPWVGGKQRLYRWLIPLIPCHTAYVEVFGGAASLLLNKPRSPVECYNDRDGLLVNLLLCIKKDPQRILAQLNGLPYSA